MPHRIHVHRGPQMREHHREPNAEHRWCFKCRKKLPHEKILMVPVGPGYHGPHWRVECSGCGEDHTRFPGT